MIIKAKHLKPGMKVDGLPEPYVVEYIKVSNEQYTIKFTNGNEWKLSSTSMAVDVLVTLVI